MNAFNINGFHIKNYKAHETSRGVAFTCTVHHGSRNIGRAEQSGRGGETELHFGNTADQQAFKDTAATRPSWTYDGVTIPANPDGLIEELITGWENDRETRRSTICQTSRQAAFGTPETIYFALPSLTAPTPEVLAQIRQSVPEATNYWVRGEGWKAL